MAIAQWSVGERGTVLDVLERAVAKWPDAPFVDFSGVVYSYREVDLRSTRFAHSLRDLGLKAGETLVTILDNSIDPLVAWIAANKLGAIWVPINTACKGAPEPSVDGSRRRHRDL
jgi:crotonobetaine/carnitine-CoA ligase